MYRILIVDDEPLVQIGLRSLLQRDFSEDFIVAGTSSNGRDALSMIEEHKPDIVFADIKMPVMSGLELMEEARKRFGSIPVFIILTAYEDFELARRALANQAVDYIVKIELNSDNLKQALERCRKIIDEKKYSLSSEGVASPGSIAELRRRFMLRLLRGELRDRERLIQEGHELGFERFYDRYVAVYCQILPPASKKLPSGKNHAQFFTTCYSMVQEIIRRHSDCYVFSDDLHHLILLFYFDAHQAVADQMAVVDEALDNAFVMIHNYFNASLRFGVGTVVNDPLQLSETLQEAKIAEKQSNEKNPIRRFSHIVGANRRSGKDRLISEIQSYIDENLSGRLMLNEVAESFGLSPAYLSVIFKKNAEIGFSEYVYTKKIEKAKELLLSGDMKIYEVADALGFESAYYFSKVFKKVGGHSPREYIQQKAENED